jgi:hypothetical protein
MVGYIVDDGRKIALIPDHGLQAITLAIEGMVKIREP